MRHPAQISLPQVEVMVLEQMLKLLGAGQRLEILRLLAERPRYVNELAGDLFIPADAVSRDLSELRSAGLVTKQHEGTRRKYLLTPCVGVQEDQHSRQFAVTTKNGDWLLAHVHGAVNDFDMVAPPNVMVGQSAWPKRIAKVS